MHIENRNLIDVIAKRAWPLFMNIHERKRATNLPPVLMEKEEWHGLNWYRHEKLV
jgi:hypothetical protein